MLDEQQLSVIEKCMEFFSQSPEQYDKVTLYTLRADGSAEYSEMELPTVVADAFLMLQKLPVEQRANDPIAVAASEKIWDIFGKRVWRSEWNVKTTDRFYISMGMYGPPDPDKWDLLEAKAKELGYDRIRFFVDEPRIKEE